MKGERGAVRRAAGLDCITRCSLAASRRQAVPPAPWGRAGGATCAGLELEGGTDADAIGLVIIGAVIGLVFLHPAEFDHGIEGDAGFVVPYMDISAASDAIIQLILDPSLRNTLGQNGRKKVLERHNTDKSVASVEAIIQKYLPLQVSEQHNQ